MTYVLCSERSRHSIRDCVICLVDDEHAVRLSTDGKNRQPCKRRGFIFQSSEIYGGLNGAWDYGPLGVELKRNLKNYWWRVMVRERDDVVGMDGSILTHRAVLKASGHAKILSAIRWSIAGPAKRGCAPISLPEKKRRKTMPELRRQGFDRAAPVQSDVLDPRRRVGRSRRRSPICVLKRRSRSSFSSKTCSIRSRKKLPFGIAQIGKAFRNEINPRNFTFRSREFEQMELEYFCRPEQGMELLEYWKEERLKFYENIGIPREQAARADRARRGARLLFQRDLRYRIRISRSDDRSSKASPIGPITI